MRVYIIGNDGITLCREPPTAMNEGEIVVASNEELHAAELSGKRLLALWNALPGVEKRKKVGDRDALIDQLWSAIEALPDPGQQSDTKPPSKQEAVIAMLQRPEGATVDEVASAMGWQRHTARSTRGRRTNLRSPERERHPAPVELACEIGGRLFAIEHTGIEPFPGHMQLEAEAGVHFRPIEAMVAGRLPPNEHFELHMPVKATQGLKGIALRRVHETIASWITATAPTLPIARFGRYVTPIRSVMLPGVPFPVTLHRTTTEGFPARFTIHHTVEANHEAERVKRICEACQRKYPKLARWKRDHGARTVLVLEENDIQLTNQQVVADALLEVEQTMPDRPDEVYLVSTAVETPWWSFALRVGQRDYYDFSRAFECVEEIDPATLMDLTGR